MTRPKTYGEFADANQYTRVDERLRDREYLADDLDQSAPELQEGTMETTQMRFKDLLVSDLGPLPADATINEDLYDLLTKPHVCGIIDSDNNVKEQRQ